MVAGFICLDMLTSRDFRICFILVYMKIYSTSLTVAFKLMEFIQFRAKKFFMKNAQINTKLYPFMIESLI